MMSKRFSILLIVLTIVSGLIGGAITGRIWMPKVAIAQDATQNKVLTVEKLRIVDKNGKVGASLSVDESGSAVLDFGSGGYAMMNVDATGNFFTKSVGGKFTPKISTQSKILTAEGLSIIDKYGVERIHLVDILPRLKLVGFCDQR
jgi:hypothetical protein